MFDFSRVPLAWLNLAFDKRRFVIHVLGVAFAVFLMFVELGFYNALLDAPVKLIKEFNGEIIVVSTARYALNVREKFTTRRLDQARMAPGVLAAYPVYLEYDSSWWKDTCHDRKQTPDKTSELIRVIAFDPDQPVLNNSKVDDQCAKLKMLYNILLDRKSKPEVYGEIKPCIDRELAEKKVHVAGLFSLGTDFTSNGSVIMSDLTYARLFPNELTPEATLNLADVGVVHIEQGSDIETVRQAICKVLPHDRKGKTDVKVLTKDKYIAEEKEYWRNATPVGFIFQFGLCMGFLVGTMICFQIISTDVAEHLPEYATLKAMGYGDLYLSLTVMREALWLAVLGFGPGWGLSYLLYELIDMLIGLPMEFTILRVLLIFGLTILMCVASGLIALRKVRKADPAEVFA
ncbi:MAG: ABC transporter permease DevC [Gemmataceae bacterium]